MSSRVRHLRKMFDREFNHSKASGAKLSLWTCAFDVHEPFFECSFKMKQPLIIIFPPCKHRVGKMLQMTTRLWIMNSKCDLQQLWCKNRENKEYGFPSCSGHYTSASASLEVTLSTSTNTVKHGTCDPWCVFTTASALKGKTRTSTQGLTSKPRPYYPVLCTQGMHAKLRSIAG